MSAFLIVKPRFLPPDLAQFEFSGRRIRFLQAVAITTAEHQFAMAEGSDKLEALLEEHGHLITRDPNRQSVVRSADLGAAPSGAPRSLVIRRPRRGRHRRAERLGGTMPIMNTRAIAIAIALVVTLAGCGRLGPPQQDAPAKAQTTSPTISYAGGDGSSLEQAVAISGARGEEDGIEAEYSWLRRHYRPNKCDRSRG